MDPGRIVGRIVQPFSDAVDIAKAAVTSRTKTAESFAKGVTDAKSQKVETKSTAIKFTAATVGAIIGTALKPFVFNPGNARAELYKSGVDEGAYENLPDKELRQLRSDFRAIISGLKRLPKDHECNKDFPDLKSYGDLDEWTKFRGKVDEAVAEQAGAMLHTLGLVGGAKSPARVAVNKGTFELVSNDLATKYFNTKLEPYEIVQRELIDSKTVQAQGVYLSLQSDGSRHLTVIGSRVSSSRSKEQLPELNESVIKQILGLEPLTDGKKVPLNNILKAQKKTQLEISIKQQPGSDNFKITWKLSS